MPSSYSRNLLLLALFTAVILSFGWVGYMGSDEDFYVTAATGWLNDFPFVGENHWSLRHPYILALAASFAGLGITEFSLTLVGVLFYAGALWVAYDLLTREFSPVVALVSVALAASLPLFAVAVSIPAADTAELFLVFLSLWAFYRAVMSRNSRWMILAGVALGLAWVTRETAIGLVILYTLLFLRGYRVPRSHYWVMAAGFALPVLAEYLYLLINTGDYLYRFHIDTDQGISKLSHDYIVPETGNVEAQGAARHLNPILVLLLNQEFMILALLFLPVVIWAARARGLNDGQRVMVQLLLGLALVWILSIGYVLPVRKLPRYFEVSALAAAMLIGLWITIAIWPRHRWLAGLLALAMLGANLVGIYVENKQPIYGVRTLVAWLEQHPGTLYTDPRTYKKAEFLLRAKGMDDRLRPSQVPLQRPYYYNPNQVQRRVSSGMDRLDYTPPESWQPSFVIKPDDRLIGYPLRWIGLDRQLPAGLLRRLVSPVRTVSFYGVESDD